MERPRPKIIVTLGPATRGASMLRALKARGVDFVRVNLSHSSLPEMEEAMALAAEAGIPFVVDTEGSQVRTGGLAAANVSVEENDVVELWRDPIEGDGKRIALKPPEVLAQLEEGDILHLDFDMLTLRVIDVSTRERGFVKAQAVTAGTLGRNKAVVIDPATPKRFALSPLSPKDGEAIALGLAGGAQYIAASFMRSGDFVEDVRRATRGKMKIISKIECVDALENLDDIIERSDYLLIDRGDLSKEVPLEKVPLLQKMILRRAAGAGKGVFVATNLLETMVERRRPTRAEVHDVTNLVLEGAYGLALAAETAVGKHPLACVTTLQRIVDEVLPASRAGSDVSLPGPHEMSRALVEPHGGKLVARFSPELLGAALELPRLAATEEALMDAEQIALGAMSPLSGFMGSEELASVLSSLRLPGGAVWPIPVILDASEEDASRLPDRGDVLLTDGAGEPRAILRIAEKYRFDRGRLVRDLYGTQDDRHPGVRFARGLKPVFLGGDVTLLARRTAPFKAYELTPWQTRRLFAERGWRRVVGFHTRNVIHRGHEHIQLAALERTGADGLFIHPVIGKKKPGDFTTAAIVRAYELMKERFYPKGKVIFGTFATFSRYAGPREALFTALCRKNFGCSHFIVGRDHTGAGNFYEPDASHRIFDRFPDLGIEPVRFGKVSYSPSRGRHFEEGEGADHVEASHVSGTEARAMLERGEAPPEWFMRPEISLLLLEAMKRGEKVFVE